MGEIPARVKNIHDLLRDDITAREKIGDAEYGQPLLPFNGRNSILDAYEECLDMAVYLRQEIEERKVLSEQIASLQETLGGLGHEVPAPAEDVAKDATDAVTTRSWDRLEDVPDWVRVKSPNSSLIYRKRHGLIQFLEESGEWSISNARRSGPWYEVEQ